MKNDDSIAKLNFAEVSPLYMQKVERKERTQQKVSAHTLTSNKM